MSDLKPTGYASQDAEIIERLNADVLTLAGQVRKLGTYKLELEAEADTLRARLAAAEAREVALREALETCPVCDGQGYIEQRPSGCRGCGRQYPQTHPNRPGLNLVPCETCKPYRAAPSGGAALTELREQERAAGAAEMRERCAKAVENCFPCAPTHAQDEAIWYAARAIRALPATESEGA